MVTKELPPNYRQIFEKLKGQIDLAAKGLNHQSPAFIEEFAYTYLRCLNILSQIKAQPAWKEYTRECQKIVVQANLILYPEESTSLKGIIHYLWITLPSQIWQCRYYHLASCLILSVTTMLGFLIVINDFEMASLFLGSLRSSHELEAYLFSPSSQQDMLTYGRDHGVEIKSMFALALLLNNVKVALLCFVSGFLYGLPTFLILVQTGLMLGALPALFYHGDLIGLGAWLLPHGVPEISAIVLAGGVGLKLGLTMLNPGDIEIKIAAKKTLKEIAGTVIILILLLLWAALVESFVRQSNLSYSSRYLIAVVSIVPICFLFIRAFFASRCNDLK